mgnify:FL=1
MYLTMKNGKKVYLPTDEEDAQIQAGIDADPDAPEWTDEMFANAIPYPEYMAKREKLKAGRPLVNGIAKKPVTLRLDEDLVEQLRASGKGWQTRLNAQIRQWINEEAKGSNFAH